MAHRWTVLVVGLMLLTAGCVGTGGDPVANASNEEAPDEANETEEDREASDEEGSGSQDASEDDDADEDEERDNSTQRPADDGSDDEEREGYPPWPDPEEASIRPGVQIDGTGQCTSNFLFRTPDNATLMLGVAAHCIADAPQTGSSGCSDDVDPAAPGTEVDIEGASQPGVLVYSSWYTMQQANVTEDSVCRSNDFALVAIDPGDRGEVHPAAQEIGGPTGPAAGSDVQVGDRVQWYGASSMTPDSSATNRHEGQIVTSGDWRFQAYSAAPGVPGDSGSGVMLDDGSAAGVLVTVQTVYPAANGITKLDPALAFAHEHGVQAELVTWSLLDSGSLE